MFSGSRRKTKSRKALSELEHTVMQAVWREGPVTADRVREALLPAKAIKDSTVRTILRRLEEKGYLQHRVEGRTFIYRESEAPLNVAMRAVRQVIDRFCGGSVEELLVGMVENEVVDPDELKRLADRIARNQE